MRIGFIRTGIHRAKRSSLSIGFVPRVSTTTVQRSDESLAELKVGHFTLGGLNKQFSRVYVQNAGIDALEKAINVSSIGSFSRGAVYSRYYTNPIG